MQIIKRGEVTRYAFDARDEPVLHVKQEESFQIETDDALSGLIEDDSDNPKVHQFVGDAHVDALNAAWPPKYNPVVGPIYVEGCEAGDVLAVNLETIDPWRYGFSGILPGIGPYGESTRWDGQCAVPRVQVIEHLPGPSGKTRDGKGKYSDKLTWDLEPFCGTLATAPEREVFTSLLGQGPFGGNIDCRDVAPGHTILLNSYHDGALLYIGDIHGGQGDTEYTGIADETRATVQLNCTVIKNKRMPTVRIVKPESIVAVWNQPADGACRLRCLRQHDRLVERGLRNQAAGQLHSHVLRSGIPHPDLSDGARHHHRARRRRGIPETSAGPRLLAAAFACAAANRSDMGARGALVQALHGACADGSLTDIESERKRKWISD